MIKDPIVLLVDDSVNDALLMRTVFDRAGFINRLELARGGEDAIARLRGDGDYRDRSQFPMPTIVLLDLNMPRVDGFSVLGWIRKQAALKLLPVFILSASSRSEDVDRAYELGATSYLVKPSNLDGLMQLAQSLAGWLKISHFAAAPGSIDNEHFSLESRPRGREELTEATAVCGFFRSAAA